jgi:ABC-type Fe3+/spermidine/putrescine transport system ATPase subunit
MSDRVAIMNAGCLVQVGTPAEVYDAPESRFVSEFLGDANVLRIEHVLDQGGGMSVLRAEGGAEIRSVSTSDRAGEGMFAMFRPAQTLVHPADPGESAFPGKVAAAQFYGGVYRWQIDLPGGGVVSAQASENRLPACTVGDSVWITVAPDKVRLVRQ